MKERIQQKAEELFRLYGIRSVTMDEIASHLGISKKTIYLSFADKEEVVRAVFDAMLSENKNCCMEGRNSALNPVHEIFLAFDQMQVMMDNMNPSILFDLEKYHPEVFKKFHEYKYSFLYDIIRKNLEWGVEEGLYRDDINIDILTRFRIESAMMAFNPQAFPDNKKHFMLIQKEITEHFLYGVVSAKGSKLIEKYKKKNQPKPLLK
ncbi:MAG: hypothetical protein JWN76_2698 [Chitinophagaceae bacterium]|nr:hypothetical protein [Chitinophagaceae bacterium]